MTKDFALRKVDPKYFQRAASLSPNDAVAHLDAAIMSLHVSLDQWRYHEGPAEEVSLCVDAVAALWTVIEQRSDSGDN